MKNLLKTIVLIALALSCAREIGNENIPEASRRYNLSFDGATKTELSGTGSKRQVNWTAGDAIQYYTEPKQSSPESASVSLDGDKAYITIPRGRADEFINAVYGAISLTAYSSTSDCMYVSSPVKNNQAYTSFADAHICAAFSSDIDNQELTFHNAAAIVKFTSSAKVDKIVFYGNNSETITGGSNGNLKITHASGALTVEPSSTGGTTVTVQTGGVESDFYIAILPVNFAGGITIDCYDSNLELIATQKTTKAINAVSTSGNTKVLDLGSAQNWITSAPPVAVDLGLSVKWARVNLGATEPEGLGDYYSWGETSPKSTYNWSDYSFGQSKNGPFSKYVLDSDLGTIDHKTVLDPGDDAAHVILGGDWRIPTQEEVQELMSNCSWSWTTRNGVPGYRVTSNKPGFSGISIFLPANGMIGGSSPSDVGTIGNYWSASLSAEVGYHGISPYFSQSYVKSGNCYRYFGLGIRPVEGAIVPVSGIEIPATLEIITGRTSTLTATVSPDNATYKNITWGSSDESIATVDATGKVTAVSIGKATITAYSADASKTACCEVTVCQLIESITLDKTELEMYVGDAPVTLVATVLPDVFTMKNLTWTSAYPEVATVDSDGKVTALSKGSTKISVRATDGSGVSTACMVTVKLNLSKPDSVEAVDLGLPSGLKWASCNVGATKPFEYGEYFAWGETQPKENYNWWTYKWCNGDYNLLTKYCTRNYYWNSSEPMDNKSVLDPEDDVASANWGGGWRMPTDEEWTELWTKCKWTWTSDYNGTGIAGRIVTSIMSGYETKSFFLPAAGHRCDTDLYNVGSGDYWSSSLGAGDPYDAWYVTFGSGLYNFRSCYRSYGLSIRPVYCIHPVSVTLDKSELSLFVGASDILTATVLPNDATNKSISWSSSDESVAAVDQNGKVTAVSIGKASITVTTIDGAKTGSCEVTVKTNFNKPDSVEAVDLGLPSGLKWASCNVGASKPEEYGAYFAWGESAPKSDYNWTTYKWCNGGPDKLTKYCTNSSYWGSSAPMDNKTLLDSDDDAASANWGGGWRMPIHEEWTELMENCTWTWTSNYNGTGIAGRIVTSNITGYETKSIFLPAAGYRDGTGPEDVGSCGYYWSSSLSTLDMFYSSIAWYVHISIGNLYRGTSSRYRGQSIRPVCP